MRALTPRQIVEELNRHIVGQDAAKRAVAIALRNRWRRQQLPESLQKEVTPKNIMMIGPTGVGKTEIARRLAELTGAPFVKVEATKYTEIGYVGRDVESMVRELVQNAVHLVRQQERKNVEEKARKRVEEQLLDLLMGQSDLEEFDENPATEEEEEQTGTSSRGSRVARRRRVRERLRVMLAQGKLDDRRVEVPVEQRVMPPFLVAGGGEPPDLDLENIFEKIFPKKVTRREMTVAEAREYLFEKECDALINPAKVQAEAIRLAENLGIIFIDEIDKIVSSGSEHGPDVSREGVQRDLLPIVEGTTVLTRYGTVKTDHILFIAAGAFHRAKPSDLMPELQGRFPIRVELSDLTKEDFVRILKEPENSLIRQYQALLKTEGVELEFEEEAIVAIAEYAYRVNQTTQNIGARRLATIMERLLEEISFEASEIAPTRFVVTKQYVEDRLRKLVQDEDLTRFIL
ncbi:MAG: ATP-dependent protease ATPase subunit HslU [Thermoguttaceae bacterium]|nr:ATP-dependent protease ATPase subunit HslU [Thermoguttaceae bacterium]MDW8077865.1 ATP-dependent protease ATPase subunit HslU [Thermoguttaceae bacterium]